MTYCYLADEHPLTILECKEKWNSISEMDKRSVDSPIPCVIHLKQTYVERRDHSSLQVKLHLKPSGEPTVAGGVYLLEQWPSKIAVRSDITVMFMMVSSYLAECTNDPEFLEYAVHSAICVRDHFMDSQTSLVKDCMVDAQDPQEQPKGDLSCHLTGIAIEGFSVLATVSGDDIWRKLAVEMAMSAMNFSKWHGPDGILAVGSEYKPSISNDVTAFKGLLCRGLLAAYQRNPTDKPFCNLVRGYINVQCNALLELSSRGDSYGVDWRGPYVGPYPHGQLAALDAFIAGVGVNN
ncbi:hypothetical protein FRC02_006014 [Tulasnella sp. 418]|nr:hypothetical protein FRC02_006014 [Tulasnella sp. 418]